jgi:bacteriocin biosynthesis cyclodehydratase domain-containing protein
MPPLPPLPLRPEIKPGLRRVWRDAATLQIGLTPDTGVVVTGLGPLDVQLIAHLDGTRRVSDLSRWAGSHGVDHERVRDLLDLLHTAGVLSGAPADRAHLHRLGPDGLHRRRADALAWAVVYPDAGDGFELLARRTGRGVVVAGRGRTADACAASVRRTGVQLAHLPTEVALDQAHDDPAAGMGASRAADPLVVLVADDTVSTTAGATLLAQDRPHLAVAAGADRAVVGPLVVPGRTACLRCIELTRADRDPGWPAVAAQLDAPPAAVRGESSLTELAAALVALQVACWVDARRTPASIGATLTVMLPDGLTSRRAWPRHPRCGCAGVAASVPADAGG